MALRKLAGLRDAVGQATAGQDSTLLQLADELQREIDEYENIRDGHTNVFALDSINDLGDAVVKARLARGWSHRQLAGVLGVSEQMIQRDEARSYERAGASRLADIVDALGYELTGLLVPSYLPVSRWCIGSTTNHVGFANSFAPGLPSAEAFTSTTSVTATVQVGAYGAAPIFYGSTPLTWRSGNAFAPNPSKEIGASRIVLGELWTAPGSMGRTLAPQEPEISPTGTLAERTGADS